MKIVLAQFTIATPDVSGVKTFWADVLGDSVNVGDHQFFYTLDDKEEGTSLAIVPHNGDEKWDKPWITLATDDFPAALAHLKSLGITEIENSGPTDDEGNPIACVLFRDPENRLIMLATME